MSALKNASQIPHFLVKGFIECPVWVQADLFDLI